MSAEPSTRGGAPPGSDPFEQRLGRALAALLAERGTDPELVEVRLGLPRGAVARLVRGDGTVDLATLQRVLLALGAEPGEFLAGLYGGGAGAPGQAGQAPPAALDREQIESLLGRITTTVRGLIRLLDARSTADDLQER